MTKTLCPYDLLLLGLNLGYYQPIWFTIEWLDPLHFTPQAQLFPCDDCKT